MKAMIGVALGALALAACANNMETGTPMANGESATAMLMTAQGAAVGRASATDVAGGVRFAVDAMAMPPGTHGAHIHTTGRCDPPAFETAGGHWNPTAMAHGTLDPQGPHKGDIPNLVIDSAGRGTVGAVIPGVTVAQLLDADGAAFVVHADADDYRTDPSGNSGARIACGVFQPS